MRGPWLSSLPAIWLAACGFGSPDSGGSGDASDGGGDGGGGPDGTPACADGDRDTVCDDADRCPDHDDRLDVDTDGLVDGCDDWLCGVKPGDPGDPMADSSSDGRSWRAAFIDIGNARRVAAAPGQSFSTQSGWGIRLECPSGSSCRGQLEIGYGDSRLRCLFDDDVSNDQWRIGSFDVQLTAPPTPGVYEIRLNAGRAASCGTGTAWYGGDPGPESTIAILCVR